MKYLHQLGGLEGWQWVYLTQGLPAIILGMVVWAVLKNGADGGWLNEQECLRLAENLRQCRSTEHKLTVREELMQVVRMPAIWLLAMATFLELGAVYAWGFWLPTLIRNLGVTNWYRLAPSLRWRAWSAPWGHRGGATLGPLHEPALVFLGAHLHRRRADELRACWRTLRAFDDGHRGHRPEPERRLAAAGGRSDGLSPRQIAPAGIAFISSIGILGGAVFPAVFGYLKSRTGTQYRETT